MTENNFTPPPDLVELWVDLLATRSDEAVFSLAAQWGADQELEACVDFVQYEADWNTAEKLRAARRPKPPSLKEQGLTALKSLQRLTTDPNIVEPLRRALEQLPE